VEGDPVVAVANLAVDAPVADLHTDATEVRELRRVESENGDRALIELMDDRVGVLIFVVGDD